MELLTGTGQVELLGSIRVESLAKTDDGVIDLPLPAARACVPSTAQPADLDTTDANQDTLSRNTVQPPFRELRNLMYPSMARSVAPQC